MPKETKLARISIRAHQLAAKIDPAGNRARAIEFALELALIVEYRGPNREVGEGLMTRHASAELAAFMREGEVLWSSGARQALDELEERTEKRAEERARTLAVEALPHMVTSAVKKLFNDQGLPCPPISVGVDGSVELGDPPKGLGPIEA